MEFNFDLLLVSLFMLTTLIVGITYGKNVHNIKEYAVGHKDFSTSSMIATIVATWVSGSGFYIIISKVYSKGFSYLISDLGFLLSPIILATIFIPRMKRFLGKNSIAEAMGELYDQNVRIIIAIAGIIGSAGSIAIQFSVFGTVLGFMTDMPGYISIFIAGMIATIYSAFGGIRSVAYTDLLQFVTFCFIIPLIGLVLWNFTNEADFSINQALALPKFNFGQLLNINNPKLQKYYYYCTLLYHT